MALFGDRDWQAPLIEYSEFTSSTTSERCCVTRRDLRRASASGRCACRSVSELSAVLAPSSHIKAVLSRRPSAAVDAVSGPTSPRNAAEQRRPLLPPPGHRTLLT